MLEAALQLINTKPNRPLSVVGAGIGSFVPGTLIIFLAQPALFTALGLNGVILLSVAISFPILALWYCIFYAPFASLRRAVQNDPQAPQQLAEMFAAIPKDDPLEWPCLLFAGWFTNITLFAVAAVAYFVPIRIGATLLLVASVLMAIYLTVVVILSRAFRRLEQDLRKRTAVGAPVRFP